MIFHRKKLLTSKTLIAYLSILFISSLIFSNNSHLHTFFNSFFAPTATISVDKATVCESELVTITFEGLNGMAPYTFTYTINNGTEETISTNPSENSAELPLNITTEGTYIYKLTNIKDSTGASEVVTNQTVTIDVNAPPTVAFSFTSNVMVPCPKLEFACMAKTMVKAKSTDNFIFKLFFTMGTTFSL
ncbi:hypothetical protein [uncultured Polaribacter sp.]|uniref:hypothetical protein n=1 Tax=uncultured Polaribacter sp. TaxID=174711 RepID=UPI0026063416|nr:hypothetical protein [uncultured Polaribacter sp.]